MSDTHNEFDDLSEKVESQKDLDPFFKRFLKKLLASGKRLTNGDAENVRLNGEVTGQVALCVVYHILASHSEPRDWRVMLAKEFGKWLIAGAVVVLCVWLVAGIFLTIYGHGAEFAAEHKAVVERVSNFKP